MFRSAWPSGRNVWQYSSKRRRNDWLRKPEFLLHIKHWSQLSLTFSHPTSFSIFQLFALQVSTASPLPTSYDRQLYDQYAKTSRRHAAQRSEQSRVQHGGRPQSLEDVCTRLLSWCKYGHHGTHQKTTIYANPRLGWILIHS